MDTIDCINGEQKPGLDLAHAQVDINPHILRMLEGCFRLTRPTWQELAQVPSEFETKFRSTHRILFSNRDPIIAQV